MRAIRNRWIGFTFLVSLVLAGCSKEDNAGNKQDPAKQVTQVELKKDNNGKTIAAQTTALTKDPKLPTFKEAVILDPAPEGELQPPEKTYTGKNAVKIYESIATDLWDKVTFTNNDGKPLRYQAILKTDLGDIHLDLNGEHAPNHVRNFVSLARAGYYDGMDFYYSLHRKVEDGTVAYIEAGCPRGTGETGSGSIGYWLSREVSEKLTHTEGTLTAALGPDPDSAACRFLILAEPNPFMDGRFTIFGRVTKGLDIVRTINKRPVTEFDRLEKPVVIRSVTIQTIVQ